MCEGAEDRTWGLISSHILPHRGVPPSICFPGRNTSKEGWELVFSRFFFFSGCGYYTNSLSSQVTWEPSPLSPHIPRNRVRVQCWFQLTGATWALHKLLAAGKRLGSITWQVLRHALLLILSGNPNVYSVNWDPEQREKFERATLGTWVVLTFSPVPFLPYE